MSMTLRSTFGYGVVLLALGAAAPLPAQLEIGTWVRRGKVSTPGSITMTIEACCQGGRRLTYHIDMAGTKALLTIETRLDGRDAPVLLNGKPSGQTMAITRLDAHHATTIATMNGRPFGTSRATLSADGRTLTVVNDFSTSVGSQTAGKSTEVWVKQ